LSFGALVNEGRFWSASCKRLFPLFGREAGMKYADGGEELGVVDAEEVGE
jgi:hypothetical protein